MLYGSVCSGIEAASVAWHPLGWEAAWLSEIEPFPSAVLAHHYPTVPNRGDMTRFQEWPDDAIDLLVGGTPCLLAKGNDSHAADLDNYVAHTLRADGFDASEDGSGRGTPLIAVADTLVGNGDAHSGYRDEKVRRITPTECERLQGFPDGYTAIPFRKKPAADGPRYKALGNSMAVNVMRVLGSRIAKVEAY